MKTLTLATAVLAVVASKINSQAQFSAYDVTSELRSKVNVGDYEISDLQREQVDNLFTYRIEHDKVRSLVTELYENDLLPAYTQGYQKGPRGSFKVFQPTNPVITNPAQLLAQTNIPPASQQAIVAQLTNGATADISNLADPLKAYIANRVQAGSPPTLKEIQSRFKGHNFTCRQYADAVKALGFTVNEEPYAFSQSKVS